MKGSISLLAMACLCWALPSAAPADIVETFASDNATWTLTTITNTGSIVDLPADWSETGGNPGGHLIAGVTSASVRPYAFGLDLTVSHLFGDMTGLLLTTDFKTTGEITGPAQTRLVRFYVGTHVTDGNNFFVSNDAFSWDPNEDDQWTTHQVPLVASNFLTWPNLNAGTRTFDEVIANPDAIGLVFASDIGTFTSNFFLGFNSTTGAQLAMDNFGVVVPEPTTLAMLTLGLCAGALRRRTGVKP